MADFTHFDSKGDASMVDVGDKTATERSATAKGRILGVSIDDSLIVPADKQMLEDLISPPKIVCLFRLPQILK